VPRYRERQVLIDGLVHRGQGYFTGRELYFFDPSATDWNCATPPGAPACLRFPLTNSHSRR